MMRLGLLPLIILFSSLAAVPKIYLGQIWLALLFDALFLVLMAKLVIGRTRSSAPRYLFFVVGLLNFIAILQVFNPGLQEAYNALHGYRSTGLYILAMYIPLLSTVSERTIRNSVKAVILVSLLSAINALRQYFLPLGSEIDYANTAGGAAKFLGDEFQGSADSFRPFSTFVTSVHLALYLSIGLIASYFSRTNKSYRKIIPLVIVLGILITLSRTSYIAIGAMLVVMFFAAISSGAVKFGRFALYGILVVFLGSALAFTNELIMARLVTLANVEDVSSFQSRFELWKDAADVISANPWGLGTGSASWAFKETLDLGSDSGYLKLLTEFGWLGGGIYFMFLIFIGFSSFIAQRQVFRYLTKKKRLPDYGVWLLASAALVFTNLVQMLTNQTLEAYPNNFLFWLACGFILNKNVYLKRMKQEI